MIAMMDRVRLDDEEGRLAALTRSDVLDSVAEPQFDRITALICSALDVPMAAVSLIDRDRQWFKSSQGLNLTETERDIAFCDHAIRRPTALVVNDARQDPRFASNPLVTGAPHLLSYAGVPLQTPDGYNVGTICALDTRARNFSKPQMEMLANLAAVTVDALEVRMIANFDHLTGSFSRRAFLSQLDLEISRRSSRRYVAALVLFDLDHFKLINDRYGHGAGDSVLRAVGRLCRVTLRRKDVVGRIGGEEFGILLPDTDAEMAIDVAERMRAAIADMEIPGLPGVRVTASFGIAGLTPAVTSNSQWLAMADAPLYSAKQKGRNCCEHIHTRGILGPEGQRSRMNPLEWYEKSLRPA
ncbi:GGDEF domain-containing protein [Polymorphobacter multimanifer]|uniref:sensor domain-containing diguanylate cyclase n=1 Tax=Polymorphobacter multimanifer TaxID=1070431 RepID=UPI0019AD0B1D|nr:sensor domain-containing diguanylate cyclase [Polymorphobacter multimanifer]GGI71296.1 GGDEF domain-containing protein [Polymorphobacter multimanifer]